MPRSLFPTVLCALIALGGSAWAEDGAPKKKHGAPAAAEAGAPISGVITSIAESTMVIKVGKGKKGVDRTFTTDAKTTVQINGKAATLADLQPEMTVEITATADLATAINQVAAPERKAKKDKKEKKE